MCYLVVPAESWEYYFCISVIHLMFQVWLVFMTHSCDLALFIFVFTLLIVFLLVYGIFILQVWLFFLTSVVADFDRLLRFFLPLLRLLCCYSVYIDPHEVVDFCSLLWWPTRYFNHSETHNHSFSFLPRHHLYHNLNHCPLSIG